MKALGYARISKDEEASISLDYQRAEIEKFCQREGLNLLGIEVDNGVSGKSIKSRPAVQRVIHSVDLKTIDCVVVFKSDRMSRNGLESLQIENLMNQRGVVYFSTTEGPLACDGVDDEFLSFIRAGLNQRERKLISLRTKTALARKKERGERIGGRPPYGWQVVNGEMVHHEQEQYAIARMKALQAKGFSTREIVEALRKEGVRTRKGTCFNQTQICRILAKAA